MNLILATVLQGLFVLLISPFVSGLVKFFKARLQGRQGASPFLPYATFATLFRKQMVISDVTSWIFRAVPFVVFGSSLALIFIMPLLYRGGSLASLSDFLLVGGILVLSSIFLVLGGTDPGSAFGGMGASREMTIASLLEPIIIMVFATLSVITGSFTIDGMLKQNLIIAHPFIIFSIIALVFVALAENARYPVDNPATHLELTMVHEAMLLEYSGPYLALLEYASAIKLTVFSLLIANVIFPSTLVFAGQSFGVVAIFIGLLLGVLKVVVVMALLALLESSMVKMRFYRMQEFLSLAFLSALSGLIITLLAIQSNLVIQYHSFFAALAVLLVVLLFGRVRLKAILRYYALSSLALAGIAASLSFIYKEEQLDLWFFAIATVIIKSILVPLFVTHIERRQKKVASLASFLKPASSYLLAFAILIGVYFAIRQISLVGEFEFSSLLYASVALVMLGLAMLIVHRNVFSQIVGLLILENGIAVFVLVTVKSLPFLIEMGVFVVTILSAFILSLLSVRVREFHGSTDTEKLRNLTE